MKLKNNIMGNLDFHRKVEAALSLGLVDGKVKNKLTTLNRYRTVVAHFKREEKEFCATKENVKKVQEITVGLLTKLGGA